MNVSGVLQGVLTDTEILKLSVVNAGIKSNDSKTAELQDQKTKRNYWIIGGVIALLIITIVAIVYLKR